MHLSEIWPWNLQGGGWQTGVYMWCQAPQGHTGWPLHCKGTHEAIHGRLTPALCLQLQLISMPRANCCSTVHSTHSQLRADWLAANWCLARHCNVRHWDATGASERCRDSHGGLADLHKGTAGGQGHAQSSGLSGWQCTGMHVWDHRCHAARVAEQPACLDAHEPWSSETVLPSMRTTAARSGRMA